MHTHVKAQRFTRSLNLNEDLKDVIRWMGQMASGVMLIKTRKVTDFCKQKTVDVSPTAA